MKFQSGVAKFLVAGIFGVIIISFALSSFQRGDRFFGPQGGGASDEVAQVDGTPVSMREYQMALTRQLEFFSQMTGGNQLTAQQIEQFGIKNSVLTNLVNQKLMVNLVSKMGLNPGKEEVVQEIQALPYFKTNGQFNVELYKNLLNQNSYTPAVFESMIGDDIRNKTASKIFALTLVSKNFINDVAKLKNSILNGSAVKVIKKELKKLIRVEQSEINKYLSDAANKEKLQAAYQQNFSKYNVPEEIKASHILLTSKEKEAEADFMKRVNEAAKMTNAKNFKDQANKLTEDPSGKGKGGSLEWFSRGRMVKEFEEIAFNLKLGQISAPVKTQFGYHIIMLEDKKVGKTVGFELAKNELAQELVQESKLKEVDALAETVTNEVKLALDKNDTKALEEMKKKYGLKIELNKPFNLYDGKMGEITLLSDEVAQTYQSVKNPTTLTFKDVTGATIVRMNATKASEAPVSETISKEVATQESSNYSTKLRQELLKDLNKNSKIVTHPSLL
ncbi:MAG: peptidylprolyl isomerase [Bacteriovoracaceae bacterium]